MAKAVGNWDKPCRDGMTEWVPRLLNAQSAPAVGAVPDRERFDIRRQSHQSQATMSAAGLVWSKRCRLTLWRGRAVERQESWRTMDTWRADLLPHRAPPIFSRTGIGPRLASNR
jgi:hypothetical protein